jgi:hypothetical protein
MEKGDKKSVDEPKWGLQTVQTLTPLSVKRSVKTLTEY